MLLLRKATFTDISVFADKEFPNSSMQRGVLFASANAFGGRFLFAVSHLESPM